MIDKNWIGHAFPDAVLELERGRLKFYAQVIGVDDPIYIDEEAARRAGYPDIPAMPAFLFAAELDTSGLDAALRMLGVDVTQILHGEQRFDYHRSACAGERLTVASRIADIYDKKGGTLQFVVKETSIADARGIAVADSVSTLVVRN